MASLKAPFRLNRPPARIAFPFLAMLLTLMAQPAAAEPLTVPGPSGPLEGEMILVPDARAGIVIVPGSGPTDRDGNSPEGLRSDSYKLLAEGLSEAGVSTLRIDKRGFFGSAKAVSDPEDVTIRNYAEDVDLWLSAFSQRIGTDCVWLAGHSEGGLVALVAAARGASPCGLILLSTPGRRIGDLMREQFRRNPANAPFLDELDGLVAALEAGETRDPETISAPLRPFFRIGLQRYMIQLFAYDPVEIAKDVMLPILILQGDRDAQVTSVDAELLAGAAPRARLKLLPGVTHLLKQDVPGQPFATYSDPNLPLDTKVVEEIAGFIASAGER